MRVHDERLLLHVDLVLLLLVLVQTQRARRSLRRIAVAAGAAYTARLVRARRGARRLALLRDRARARERVLLLHEHRAEVVERLRLREVGERDGRRRRREAALWLRGARGLRSELEGRGLVDRVDGLERERVHELDARVLHVRQVVSNIELARRIERAGRRLVEAGAARVALEMPGDLEVMQMLNPSPHAVVNVQAASFDVMIHVKLAARHSDIARKFVLWKNVEMLEMRARA